MGKLILPTKAYLVLWGDSLELETQLKRMGERIGFRLIKVRSQEELQETISEIKTFVALVYVKSPPNLLPIFPAIGKKIFLYDSGSSILEMLTELENLILSTIPERLVKLVSNSISEIAPRLMRFEGLKLYEIGRAHV